MVERIDMGIPHWKNGVSGTVLIYISTMELIVRDKILGYDSYYDLRSYVESYIE